MPFIHVMLTPDGLTRQKKKRIVADITRSLSTHLGKKPEHTHIVIQTVDTDDWGYMGMLTTDWRAGKAPTARSKPRAR